MFEFTGDTLTYKLNNTNYTATTSPTIVNLSDLGYDANTTMMFNALFNNQKNLTKVLHFPKITGTNNLGYGLFGSCNNVEYIDLSNIGNLNSLHLQFNGCTSLKNLNLNDVDLSKSNYANHNNTFDNVPNDIQISMDGCNCESIVTIKQALNDVGIVTYNNNVVTNKNCTFEPYETIEYNVNFFIDEWETYNEELKADYIYMIVTNHNEDGVSSYTESDISEEVSYSYKQFEEDGEDKIKCTIYHNGNNIYEITYKGKLSTLSTISFEFQDGESKMNYTLNNTTYTATTNPYSTTLADLGIDTLTNCEGTFSSSRLTKLTSFPDTSNVFGMGSMFAYCNNSGLTSLDLSSFNTSNVTKAEMMFYNCSSLQTLNVSSFDVEQITSYLGMLEGCSSLTELIIKEGTYDWWCARLTEAGISCDIIVGDTPTTDKLSFEFDTTSVTYKLNGTTYTATSSPYSTTLEELGIETLTSCSATFSGSSISNLTSFPDTSNVTDMGTMFTSCSNLTSLDLSSFDTSNVTTMFSMFSSCSNLTSLDLSSFNTSNVTNILGMFSSCSSLQTLNVTGWDVLQITGFISYMNMFSGCTSLNKLILGEVTQEEYDWWLARLTDARIQDNVTIEYTIV